MGDTPPQYEDAVRGTRWFHSERAIHIAGWAAIVAGTVYLAWALFWAIDYTHWWFAYPIAFANVQGYMSLLSYLFSAWKYAPAPRPSAPPAGTLDVFVTTIDESYEVLAPSVVAAVAIGYPHETYVLDDGRRDWVRELCAEAGAHWITRPDNRHAKAGNLNHALSVTSGEFIVTLDADFVAAPSMADDLLGHFADPKVALVQSPQVFYNTDSFQHFDDGTDWNEQSLFHNVMMPAKNYWNAVYWCGSPAIVRRAALEAVGGVATGSVTEDIKTSVLMHRTGWRTLFDTRIRARGLAPEDYQRFFRQRLRWTSGGLQLLRTQYWRRGFSTGQRLSYLASAGQTFGSLRAMVVYLIPPVVLFGGYFPVHDNFFALSFIVLMPVVSLGSNFMFGRSSYRIIRNELFGIVGLAAYLTAYPVLFGAPAGFGVTQKGRVSREGGFPRSLYLLVGLTLMYFVCIGAGAARLGGVWAQPEHVFAFIATSFFSILMAIILFLCLLFAARHGRSAWRGLRGEWPAEMQTRTESFRSA